LRPRFASTFDCRHDCYDNVLGDHELSLQVLQLACCRGDRQLFGNISFSLLPGEALRIDGANGSGKTSLLRLLCGLGHASKGSVCWNGRDIRLQREEYCSHLVYLGHAHSLKDDLTAVENTIVASTLSHHPVSQARACQVLDALGLGDASELPIRLLSQGQRKRVALARLNFGIASTLWILDEPFAALDSQAIVQLVQTINAHLERGGIVVYTTHQDVALTAQRSLQLDLEVREPC
jgi:heme exporter protein A